jgi:MIF4G domain
MSDDGRTAAWNDMQLLEVSLKRRSYGMVRFIGELCKNGFIRWKVILNCTESLLGDNRGDWRYYNEHNIELLCMLLNRVGRLLVTKASHGSYKSKLLSVFWRLEAISDETRLPVRTKLIVEELLELRRNEW